MFTDRFFIYDKVSTFILKLLFNFSRVIMTIEDSIYKLLGNNNISNNSNFLNFVYYFTIGKYYHYRCQGYMEALVNTKCYSKNSICYWKTQLVDPAVCNFNKALSYLEKLKTIPKLMKYDDFRNLIKQVENFEQISTNIMKNIYYYNLEC